MKDKGLQVGDELIWNDGSRSVILALNEHTFHELTQFGYVFEQCYLDYRGARFHHSGRNFSEITEVVKMMQIASEV